MLSADRPNPNLAKFRDTQARAFAAGACGSFSSIARNYEGSYSSRRQERIEHDMQIKAKRRVFIEQSVRPKYDAFVKAALLSESLPVPDDLDWETLFDAEHRGPGMTGIDPEREAKSEALQVSAGFKSREQVILTHGDDPTEVFDSILAERERDAKHKLKFSAGLVTVQVTK